MSEGETVSGMWVEGTPSYIFGSTYEDLGLPSEIALLFEELVRHRLIFEKPYEHQGRALKEFFSEGKDLIISTGTGSGKTEIFLYAILGLLAQEAARSKSTE